jgi:hypothetical protein
LQDDDEEEGGRQAPRSFLTVAVDAVRRLMKWRIMHAPNDEIGVMFYGAVRGGAVEAGRAVLSTLPSDAPPE